MIDKRAAIDDCGSGSAQNPDGIKIGLETHVTLNTRTKLFCGCPTTPAEPNTQTCETCLGLPGSKPRLNKKAVELAVQAAEALGFNINKTSIFARKTYYYPDLSKNFQITQYDRPLAEKGTLKAGAKTVSLTRLHIEEDPAQIVYPHGNMAASTYSLLDYNRSGMPLLEIVTDPCLTSPAEAKAYLEELFRLLAYLGVIDSKAERVMKTDANISIKGGERVEIKNITSFAAVEKALQSEFYRQKKLHQQGKPIERQTRLYSDETGTTILMRSKEQEEDYGYIVEPDLPPLRLDESFLKKTLQARRELPDIAIARLSTEVPAKYAKVLVYRGLADYYAQCKAPDRPYLARWLCEDFLKCLNYCSKKPEDLQPSEIDALISAIKEKKITERAAKEYIQSMVKDGKQLLEILEMGKAAKPEKPEQIAETVIKENEKALKDYHSGKQEALEFLVGEFLKKDETPHPNDVRKLLEKHAKKGKK